LDWRWTIRIELAFKLENEAVLRKRFRDLTHPIVRAVLWDLAFWLWTTYGLTLCITCLWRSLEENKADGGRDTSRHLEIPSKAADIRTRGWPKEAIPNALEYLQITWGNLLSVQNEADKVHIHFHLSRKMFPQGSLK